jgi:hypothetical protein
MLKVNRTKMARTQIYLYRIEVIAMRFEFIRGIARYKGAQHLKGSFFDTEAERR